MSTLPKTYEAIREVVDSIPIVDTHEHIFAEEDWLKWKLDFGVFFRQYACVDLVSAGMPVADMATLQEDENATPEEKWKLMAPYWQAAKNTAYCKLITMLIQDIYGLPDLNEDTYAELCQRMRQTQKPGFYRMILRDKANLAISINNDRGVKGTDWELMRPSDASDQFVLIRTAADIRFLTDSCQMPIYSVDDIVQAAAKTFEKRISEGAIAIKLGFAYQRIIQFDIVAKWKAEEVFAQVMRDDYLMRHDLGGERTFTELKPLQDYLMHQVVRVAADYNLPIQIHTGILEGNGNYLAQTNPVHMTNVFMLYPQAKFDIFHIGYPYQSELGVLAKMFPNVYPDFCWAHVINPWAARQTLHEWLETVPGNKILGFGGDYLFVEGAYAHSVIARDNIARVLAEKVEYGYFDLDEAGRLAYDILRNNALRLFDLQRFGIEPIEL